MQDLTNELKHFWSKYFKFNWKFGLFLIVIICIPRFLLVLNANQTTNYQYIGLIMTISALAPFIFLSKEGKKVIGLTKPKNHSWLFLGFILGLGFSILLYFLGEFFYQNSFENWYVYIAKSYNIPNEIQGKEKFVMFTIMAVTGMIFSPIGEELYFRGIIHSSFAKSLGNLKASLIESSAFSLTHISHFGLVFINNEWKFLTTPTLIWVMSMFLVSMVFYVSRKKSKSILGAILSHAGFNLGMIFCIFYLLNL